MADAKPSYKSFEALDALLQAVRNDPVKHQDHPIVAALKTQGSLAAFKSEAAPQIVGSSLNTFKRHSKEYPGGFSYFDGLRKETRKLIQDSLHRKKTKTTRQTLQIRVNELAEQVQTYEGDMLLQTNIIRTLLRNGRNYAADSNDPNIVERCRRDQASIMDMLSARKTRRLRVVGGSSGKDA